MVVGGGGAVVVVVRAGAVVAGALELPVEGGGEPLDVEDPPPAPGETGALAGWPPPQPARTVDSPSAATTIRGRCRARRVGQYTNAGLSRALATAAG